MKSAGVKLVDHVDELVTGSDAEETKPAPDLVEAAVKKLRLRAAECAMVGDTPHDGTAARRAGVAFLGLTCGGKDEGTLRTAGALGVWRDPADLLAHLDEALAAAARGLAA